MSICVIIPMFGKAEYTDKCVELTNKNSGIDVNILVVDDGSLTPYVNAQCDVLRLPKNSGFTNATNQGILWSQKRNYDYVLTLNNDTEPQLDFIKHLLDCLELDPLAGIACSVRIHPTRGGNNVELCGADLIRGFQLFTSIDNLPTDALSCNWIPICSGLLRMDMIREIGILDKRFRNHCSDSDYCIKAKMSGWKVMLVPKSRVVHHLSITTSANKVNTDDDQRMFIEKLSGLQYAQLMKDMPLDCESKTYGKLEFFTYQK